MSLNRRDFLFTAGLGAAGSTLFGAEAYAREARERPRPAGGGDEWDEVRARFAIDPEYVHLAGMLLAPHPDSVREAVEQHRRGLDGNPVLYLAANRALERESRRAAAGYMGARWQDIALTDSTTMGTGLVYNGVHVRPDQELLTTEHDYHATHTALAYKAERSGASLRRVRLFRDAATVSEGQIVDTLIQEVRPETRVVAVTWVHSSTGLKFPVRGVADALAGLNAGRDAADRALLCVDGVHGFGVEDASMEDLGCDFFFAGTHKWIFGPRGTGVIWGRPEVQEQVSPTIPTFTRDGTWGGGMSPGGFKPFEHQWGVAQAFGFHQRIGKARVAERIHALNRQLKEEMARMPHVRLHTPMDERLSAGMVCFEVEGMRPGQVVDHFQERRIIISQTPYTPSYARFSPGLLNTTGEMERVLEVLHGLG